MIKTCLIEYLNICKYWLVFVFLEIRGDPEQKIFTTGGTYTIKFLLALTIFLFPAIAFVTL